MVELRKVELKKVEKTEMYLDVTAVLDNPNSFKINVTGTDLDLYLEERYMGKATLENNVTLKAKSKEAYDLEIKAKGDNLNAELLPIMLTAALTGKVTVRLTGEVKGKVFLFSRAVKVDIKEDVEFNQRNKQ
jgi:LEA14-like dessication related protein